MNPTEKSFGQSYKRFKPYARFFLSLLASKTQRKYTFHWLNSLTPDYLLKTPSPWITFDAIAFLKTQLKPGWQVFEYGSGGSTLFWLHHQAKCVSIEHDPQWFALMQPYLSTVTGLDYRLVLPEKAEGEQPFDIADPTGYASGSLEFKENSFQNYVSQIDSFSDNSFDLVMIDGRARPSCILHSVNKVKPGGLLILDNAERPYYTEKVGHLLDAFTAHQFYGTLPLVPYFVRTDVYVKDK